MERANNNIYYPDYSPLERGGRILPDGPLMNSYQSNLVTETNCRSSSQNLRQTFANITKYSQVTTLFNREETWGKLIALLC